MYLLLIALAGAFLVVSHAAPVQYYCQRQGPVLGTIFTYQGRCYEIITTEDKTYSEASGACRSFGGILASVTSWDIETSIVGVLRNIQYYRDIWIGLNDQPTEGYYVWEDGSPYYYHNWAINEGPSNAFRDPEDCVAMDANGRWHDYRCFQWGFVFAQNFPPRLGYICQYQAYQYGQPVPVQVFKASTANPAVHAPIEDSTVETVNVYLIETSQTPKAEEQTTEAAEPDTTETPNAETTEFAKPNITETPKAETTEAPKADTTEASEPDTTEAPKSETTEPPKPETTEPPKPETTEPPKLETTEAPKEETTEAKVEATTPVQVETTEKMPANPHRGRRRRANCPPFICDIECGTIGYKKLNGCMRCECND